MKLFLIVQFLLLVSVSCENVTQFEDGITIDKNQTKRSIVDAFSSNPIFKRVFNRGYPMSSISNSFFDASKGTPLFLFRPVYLEPPAQSIISGYISTHEEETHNTTGHNESTQENFPEQTEIYDEIIYDQVEDDENVTEEQTANTTLAFDLNNDKDKDFNGTQSILAGTHTTLLQEFNIRSQELSNGTSLVTETPTKNQVLNITTRVYKTTTTTTVSPIQTIKANMIRSGRPELINSNFQVNDESLKITNRTHNIIAPSETSSLQLDDATREKIFVILHKRFLDNIRTQKNGTNGSFPQNQEVHFNAWSSVIPIRLNDSNSELLSNTITKNLESSNKNTPKQRIQRKKKYKPMNIFRNFLMKAIGINNWSTPYNPTNGIARNESGRENRNKDLLGLWRKGAWNVIQSERVPNSVKSMVKLNESLASHQPSLKKIKESTMSKFSGLKLEETLNKRIQRESKLFRI